MCAGLHIKIQAVVLFVFMSIMSAEVHSQESIPELVIRHDNEVINLKKRIRVLERRIDVMSNVLKNGEKKIKELEAKYLRLGRSQANLKSVEGFKSKTYSGCGNFGRLVFSLSGKVGSITTVKVLGKILEFKTMDSGNNWIRVETVVKEISLTALYEGSRHEVRWQNCSLSFVVGKKYLKTYKMYIVVAK